MGYYRPETEYMAEIDSSNRIHIPATIRKFLDLKPGQLLKVSISIPVKEASPVKSVIWEEGDKRTVDMTRPVSDAERKD